MTMKKNRKDFLLINKRPQQLTNVTVGTRGLIMQGQEGKVLDNGVLVINDSVRAGLYCDEVRNITFLVAGPGKYAIETLIFAEEDNYKQVLKQIRSKYPNLEISNQNKKINRYAERLMEKLENGNDVQIIDSVREEDVVVCPECGVQCDPGVPYCMECGADLN